MARSLQSCAFAAALFLAVVGCQSYEIVQTNIFSSDDGHVVTVAYGRSESFHVNTFRNPATGKDVEFKSKLVVRVKLPDGDSFTAWQCMNFFESGTMYKTDDDEWQILVNGFTCRMFLRVNDGSGLYNEVYRGILCESPKSEKKKDSKWRSLKKDSSGNWK